MRGSSHVQAYAGLVQRVLILLLSATLAVAACGGDDDDTEDTSDTGPATSTTAALEQPETTIPVEPDFEETRLAVFIETTDGAGRTITYDEIDFLTGPEAIDAYVADGGDPGEGLPNDYYLTNPETELVTVPVADPVTVQLVQLSTDADADLDAATWDEFVASPPPVETPYWITIDAASGTVTAIEEQYVP